MREDHCFQNYERDDITIHFTNNKSIDNKYYEQLYTNFSNLGKMEYSLKSTN